MHWYYWLLKRSTKSKNEKVKTFECARLALPVVLVLLAVKRKRANSPLSYCHSTLSFLSPDRQNDDEDDIDDTDDDIDDADDDIDDADDDNDDDDDDNDDDGNADEKGRDGCPGRSIVRDSGKGGAC